MVIDRNSMGGVYAATTTPLTPDGELHTAIIGPQIEQLLQAGITGIVAIGGTGEASALSNDERFEVVRATVEAVKGRVPVLAGITTPGLADTLKLGKGCLDAGADSLMVITPYGTAPSQEGIRDYYKAVTDFLGQRVMLYDIPYLTAVAAQPETVCKIAEDGSIFAIKASNPDQATFGELVRLAGDAIAVMAGDEDLFVAEIARGAVGGVLASCNVLPRTWVEIFETAKAGELERAQEQISRLREFLVSAYAEPNPGPLKAAQALAGFDVGPVRTPNRSPDPALIETMRWQLRDLLAYEAALARQAPKERRQKE